MTSNSFSLEQLGPDYRICVSPSHKFGTDAFLLADFAAGRPRERVCDLGAGCGIIPLLWFRWGLEPQTAYAVELQDQAFEQLTVTAEENKDRLAGRLIPIHQDLRQLGKSIPLATLDLVTCNPPYKPAGHGVPSPKEARLTARHEVSCTMEDVCAAAARLLRFGGRLCVCQRPERLPDVMEAMRNHGIEPKRLRMVQQGSDKAPWLVLVEGKKGGRPFLQVEAPLLVGDGAGGFSPEMKRIYRLEQQPAPAEAQEERQDG